MGLRSPTLQRAKMDRLQNWYASNSQRVNEFVLDDGSILMKSQVDQLVGAMASFDPDAIGAVTALNELPDALQNTITASYTS